MFFFGFFVTISSFLSLKKFDKVVELVVRGPVINRVGEFNDILTMLEHEILIYQESVRQR